MVNPVVSECKMKFHNNQLLRHIWEPVWEWGGGLLIG